MKITGTTAKHVMTRAFKKFKSDNAGDSAAGLTYYGVLSIFPALFVMVSVLGMLGVSQRDSLLDEVEQVAPSSVIDFVEQILTNVQEQQAVIGLFAVLGLLVAVWSASGYISAFMRASNVVYDVPEGRPIWKTLPIRFGVTLIVILMLVAAALTVLLSGDIAERVGQLIGVSDTAVTVWSIVKWPLLVVLACLIVGVIYWAAPNMKPQGLRWLTPGSLVAVFLWLVASAGFSIYAANFASYNETYGTLAGVVIFLVWLWIINAGLLLGAEVNSAIARVHATSIGLPATAEPYVEVRDTTKLDEEQKAAAAKIEELVARDAQTSPESPIESSPGGDMSKFTQFAIPIASFTLTIVARKAVEKAFRKKTGHAPPDPTDLRDPLLPTIAWAIGSAAITVTIQTVLKRKATSVKAHDLGAVPEPTAVEAPKLIDLTEKPTEVSTR